MIADAPDVCQIAENESLLEIETTRNDVPRVLSRELLHLVELQFVLEEILLVVCELDDEWHVEHVL